MDIDPRREKKIFKLTLKQGAYMKLIKKITTTLATLCATAFVLSSCCCDQQNECCDYSPPQCAKSCYVRPCNPCPDNSCY